MKCENGQCDECGESTLVVQLGWEAMDSLDLCKECLIKALALLEERQ